MFIPMLSEVNFNCSLSVENIKEPILMEDVKVTESRITQGSEKGAFSNYEQLKRQEFGRLGSRESGLFIIMIKLPTNKSRGF